MNFPMSNEMFAQNLSVLVTNFSPFFVATISIQGKSVFATLEPFNASIALRLAAVALSDLETAYQTVFPSAPEVASIAS